MEPIASGGLLILIGGIATKSIEWLIARQNFYSEKTKGEAIEAAAQAQRDHDDVEHIKSNYERIKLLEGRLNALDDEREKLRQDNISMADDLRKTREDLRLVQGQLTQMSIDLLAAHNTRIELQTKIEELTAKLNESMEANKSLMLQLKVNSTYETNKEMHGGQ